MLGYRLILKKLIFIAIVLTAACDVPTGPPVSPDKEETADEVAECNLLRMAAEDAPVADRGAILRGCDGPFKDYSVSSTQQKRYQRISAENPPPIEVKRRGLQHERLFSYLLLRGVPPRVAKNLSTTEQYRKVAIMRA